MTNLRGRIRFGPFFNMAMQIIQDCLHRINTNCIGNIRYFTTEMYGTETTELKQMKLFLLPILPSVNSVVKNNIHYHQSRLSQIQQHVFSDT